jgi:hypothetical protein
METAPEPVGPPTWWLPSFLPAAVEGPVWPEALTRRREHGFVPSGLLKWPCSACCPTLPYRWVWRRDDLQ